MNIRNWVFFKRRRTQKENVKKLIVETKGVVAAIQGFLSSIDSVSKREPKVGSAIHRLLRDVWDLEDALIEVSKFDPELARLADEVRDTAGKLLSMFMSQSVKD